MREIDLTEIPISRDMICCFQMGFLLIRAATALTAFAILTVRGWPDRVLIIYIYRAIHEHTADTRRLQSVENL
ncbi:unnamed protein product [Nezara viridula]|uniref:Uncharacterized protein n=1 Tax=Nezara viridula TaxID=85310 RepID=A0A9P0H4V0_NEZVI|nr:unnamed protein product [Nezara viridula]